MAFAVAYSLFNTINHILNHDEFPISVYGKQQIGRLQEKVASLLDFLEDFKEEGSRLERRIRDAANEAEDVIEHWMHEHIRSTAAGLATDVEYDLGELNMAMQEINSIAEEVEELIQPNREKLQSSPTPTPAVERMLQSSPTPTPAAVGLEKQVDLLRTQSSWKELAPNMRSLIVEDAHFQSIIYLSYADLLHPFRSCFLYMCGFHDNYEIRASMLVKLWMAEGFAGDQSDAEFCVREIVRKNLASSTAMKGNGRIKSCIVHDLVRDVFKIKAIDENYERRFSNSHLDLREVARAYASTMRSIISFQRNESSLRGLRKFKLLRVLDVVDTDAYALPAYVFDLFHLRYLAFGCPMEVPSAISRLENLRSLIIRPRKKSKKYKYSRDEVYLPLEMWMMPLLTHLVSFFDLLPDPEGAASPLQTLVTLSVVKKLICTEEMMRLICNVKKLSITYFGERYQQDYQLQNLALLSRLEKLTLVVKEGSLLQLKAKPVFPEGLTKLTLGGWRFPWEDMKAIAALSELQVLKLRDHAFQGHTWNTNEECDEEVYDKYDGFVDKGKVFVSLGYLLIEECDIEKWDTKERHFPRLRHLVLKGCPKLNEIPSGIVCMLKLELIEVDRANVSLLKCVQENQKTRSISGRELKVGEL
ncbi:hypothetical protein SASPL_127428 [Salvia splendens]|uniref:Disease resistance protein RPM1 n=1 Tax=Salvia splendens TaxID=180675 RepID=A0A8X8XB51_SALSN|nr:hypothetical protein SASPL_127428 [Salvia splendens]